MKTRTFILALAATLVCAAEPAAAQPPQAPLMRGDVAGTIGWLATEKSISELPGGDDWHNSFFGGVVAGWYWTDHIKTEIDFGAGTRTSAYGSRQLVVDGRPVYALTESQFAQREVGISQQYQFFRNAWFHPHVAAGADITFERTTDHIQPLILYDDATRTGRVVEPARTTGPRTDTVVRPFIGTGFKAYVSPRGFFRADMRVAFRNGIDETLLRVGFGIDF